MSNQDVKFIVNEAIAEHCDVDFAKHEQLRRDFLSELKKIHDKLNEMTPTIEEIKDLQTAFKVGRSLGARLVAFVVGTGIILGAIYSVREWIKK